MADQSATSRLRLLLLLVGPVVLSVLLYQRDGFDPAPLPVSASSLIREVPARNDRLLTGSEKVGDGLLPGPEDLAYCAETGFLYTGCSDGWIKRVAINGSLGQVENWAFVGGRPLGLAFGPGGELVVADSEKGLMRVTGEGTAELLVGEAEGIPFRLTDGVDVAANGIIYFTDASYKYDLEAHVFDILEGRPYGRLMSFDPSINRTRVLVRDLYFANGVAISPGQDYLVFCESPMRRCSRYYIEGEKKGTIDNFVEDLPGFPDNIRYDGDGHYWIGLPAVGDLHFLARSPRADVLIFGGRISKAKSLAEAKAMLQEWQSKNKLEKNENERSLSSIIQPTEEDSASSDVNIHVKIHIPRHDGPRVGLKEMLLIVLFAFFVYLFVKN